MTPSIDYRITRRTFLGAAAAAAVAGGALLTRDGTSARAAAVRNPLYVPPTITLGSLQSPVGLTAEEATVDLGGGALSSAWAYEGSVPGPTLRARRGAEVLIDLENDLPEETITHWHGMLVDHPNDGHPNSVIGPGETYEYRFPVVQRAAMNWYHPHPHMLTGKQVNLGLAGAFLIGDAEEDALRLPKGPYEVPLVIRDAKLDRAGDLVYKPRNGGFVGDLPLVNGTRDPVLEVDTAMYRFRLLNGANARVFRVARSDGEAFRLIGNDGGLLTEAVRVRAIDMSPGERIDVLVDLRGLPVGSRVMLQDRRSGWDLLELVVTRAVSVAARRPTALSTIEPLTGPVRTREFSFDGMSRINGLEYDVDRIDFTVPFGQVERWRFRTGGNAPHPVHVHGASFQVVSRTGGRGRLFPWETGWKDTVLLLDGETVDVLIRFDAYRGLFLMHCHKLEHEDMGMMTNFEVV